MNDVEPTIWKTDDFEIRLPKRPHIDRNDGGHLVVYPKRNVSFRSELSIREAQSLALLLQALEEAYISGMRNRGLEIIWLNIQDNGNWSFLSNKTRHFHIHLYGRCQTETNQTPGQALYLPDPKSIIYDQNLQLNEEDIEAILNRLELNINKLAASASDFLYPLGRINT